MGDEDEKYVVPSCDASPHCPVHGIEVDRRKRAQFDIAKLEKKIEENESRIGELLTFKNRMLGLLVLLTLVLGGSFLYPNQHIQEANAKYIELEDATIKVRDKVDALDDKVSDVKFNLNEKINANTIELRVSNDRYLQIMTQLAEMKRLIQGKGQ